MKTVNIIILSGACCNPQLAGLDEKVITRIKEIADKKQIQFDASIVSISSAAFGGLNVGKEIGKTVRKLVTSKGMSVLPIIIFNNMIAFYGGLASVELIEEKLNLAMQS